MVIFSPPAVHLSFSGITQKVLKQFSWNLVGLWTTAKGRSSVLWLILIKMAGSQLLYYDVHMYAIFLLTTNGAVYDASDDIDFIY